MAPKLKNYSTTISAQQTVTEILSLLMDLDAVNFGIIKDNGNVKAVSFTLEVLNYQLNFRIEARPDGVRRVLKEQNLEPRFLSETHCRNVAWRLVRDWIATTIATVQIGQMKPAEAFMGFLLAPSNQTMYEEFVSSRLLGPGK